MVKKMVNILALDCSSKLSSLFLMILEKKQICFHTVITSRQNLIGRILMSPVVFALCSSALKHTKGLQTVSSNILSIFFQED